MSSTSEINIPGQQVQLNPDIDRQALARRFAATGRLQIRHILTPESANRLEQAMAREVPWSLTWYDGREACLLSPDRLAAMSPGELQKVQQQVFGVARERFTYAFGLHHMMPETRVGSAFVPTMELFFDFLRSAPMIELIAELLGEDDICTVDAQATRFGPGQFLGWHNDLMPDHDRRCAYVFNFSRDWRPDWGGYLQFFDVHGNGLDAFMPAFNTLNLFRVPQPHAVTMVSPFAARYRLAVSGWYRGPHETEA